MSNKALSYVFEHSQTKGSARVLMLAIADMANDDGECFPGRTRLAEKVNISERQLTTLVQTCEALGELRVFQRSHTAEDRRTNQYFIVGLYDQKHAPKFRKAKPSKPAKIDKQAEARFTQLDETTGSPLQVNEQSTGSPLQVVDTEYQKPASPNSSTPLVQPTSHALVQPTSPNPSVVTHNKEKEHTPLPPPIPPPPIDDGLTPAQRQERIDRATRLMGIILDAEGKAKDRDAARIELKQLNDERAS